MDEEGGTIDYEEQGDELRGFIHSSRTDPSSFSKAEAYEREQLQRDFSEMRPIQDYNVRTKSLYIRLQVYPRIPRIKDSLILITFQDSRV